MIFLDVKKVPLKTFSLIILVSLTNVFKISLKCKNYTHLQLFPVRHFLEKRLTFDLFLNFSFTFKNVNFEIPQNWTLWVLWLQKYLTLIAVKLEVVSSKVLTVKTCKICLVFAFQWHFEDICQGNKDGWAKGFQ